MNMEWSTLKWLLRYVPFGLKILWRKVAPLSPEKIEIEDARKREQKTLRFSRIKLPADSETERVSGSFKTAPKPDDIAVIAAFESHARHGARPVPRAGLTKRTVRKSIGPPNSYDKAASAFHADQSYRLPFSGFSGDGQTVRVDDVADALFGDLTRTPSGSRANETTFVMSEIGCGKSTLLTHLTYKINLFQASQTQQRLAQTLANEVVLISFDDLNFKKMNDLTSFMSEEVEPLIVRETKQQTNLSGDSLAELFGGTRRENVILAFDDLDGVYRAACRDLILKPDTVDVKQAEEHFFPFVYRLMNDFITGNFSNYGLRCVFALRLDVFRMLQAARGPTLAGGSMTDNLRENYQLDDIGSDQIVELIKKRLSLATTVEQNKGRISTIQKRLAELESMKPDFEFVSQISVQGLRHTLLLIQELSWSISSDETFFRFFSNKYFLRLFFLTSGYKHFSQINHGVVNIFLINSSYRKENNPELIDGNPAFSEDYLKDHKQTYFLKYLVLLYIHKNNTDLSEIVSLFAGGGAYEKGLVELVVYSLCEVRHGRLVRPKVTFADDAEPGIKFNGLKATPRAERLLNQSVFWSFAYLSVVVEDHWLQVPNLLAKYFRDPPGVAFLGEQMQSKMKRQFSDFLRRKAETVPVFLATLEAAAKREQQANRELFETLATCEVPMPQFAEIRMACRKELSEMLSEADLPDRDAILSVYDENTTKFRTKKLCATADNCVYYCH